MASRRIIFVLGGPGAGKGTQCKNLVRDFPSIVHLSAGDLLRTESADPDSLDGMLIDAYIKTGQIVPSEITIALLKRAIEVNEEAGKSTFLVDGFPRSLEQAERFEDEVGEPAGVLYFECSEEELLKRLAKRGETSGRIDDNPESIRKRFVTFHETSFPVITSYQEHQKVLTIPSIGTPEEVYELTKDALYKSNILPASVGAVAAAAEAPLPLNELALQVLDDGPAPDETQSDAGADLRPETIDTSDAQLLETAPSGTEEPHQHIELEAVPVMQNSDIGASAREVLVEGTETTSPTAEPTPALPESGATISLTNDNVLSLPVPTLTLTTDILGAREVVITPVEESAPDGFDSQKDAIPISTPLPEVASESSTNRPASHSSEIDNTDLAQVDIIPNTMREVHANESSSDKADIVPSSHVEPLNSDENNSPNDDTPLENQDSPGDGRQAAPLQSVPVVAFVGDAGVGVTDATEGDTPREISFETNIPTGAESVTERPVIEIDTTAKALAAVPAESPLIKEEVLGELEQEKRSDAIEGPTTGEGDTAVAESPLIKEQGLEDVKNEERLAIVEKVSTEEEGPEAPLTTSETLSEPRIESSQTIDEDVLLPGNRGETGASVVAGVAPEVQAPEQGAVTVNLEEVVAGIETIASERTGANSTSPHSAEHVEDATENMPSVAEAESPQPKVEEELTLPEENHTVAAISQGVPVVPDVTGAVHEIPSESPSNGDDAQVEANNKAATTTNEDGDARSPPIVDVSTPSNAHSASKSVLEAENDIAPSSEAHISTELSLPETQTFETAVPILSAQGESNNVSLLEQMDAVVETPGNFASSTLEVANATELTEQESSVVAAQTGITEADTTSPTETAEAELESAAEVRGNTDANGPVITKTDSDTPAITKEITEIEQAARIDSSQEAVVVPVVSAEMKEVEGLPEKTLVGSKEVIETKEETNETITKSEEPTNLTLAKERDLEVKEEQAETVDETVTSSGTPSEHLLPEVESSDVNRGILEADETLHVSVLPSEPSMVKETVLESTEETVEVDKMVISSETPSVPLPIGEESETKVEIATVDKTFPSVPSSEASLTKEIDHEAKEETVEIDQTVTSSETPSELPLPIGEGSETKLEIATMDESLPYVPSSDPAMVKEKGLEAKEETGEIGQAATSSETPSELPAPIGEGSERKVEIATLDETPQTSALSSEAAMADETLHSSVPPPEPTMVSEVALKPKETTYDEVETETPPKIPSPKEEGGEATVTSAEDENSVARSEPPIAQVEILESQNETAKVDKTVLLRDTRSEEVMPPKDDQKTPETITETPLSEGTLAGDGGVKPTSPPPTRLETDALSATPPKPVALPSSRPLTTSSLFSTSTGYVPKSSGYFSTSRSDAAAAKPPPSGKVSALVGKFAAFIEEKEKAKEELSIKRKPYVRGAPATSTSNESPQVPETNPDLLPEETSVEANVLAEAEGMQHSPAEENVVPSPLPEESAIEVPATADQKEQLTEASSVAGETRVEDPSVESGEPTSATGGVDVTVNEAHIEPTEDQTTVDTLPTTGLLDSVDNSEATIRSPDSSEDVTKPTVVDASAESSEEAPQEESEHALPIEEETDIGMVLSPGNVVEVSEPATEGPGDEEKIVETIDPGLVNSEDALGVAVPEAPQQDPVVAPEDSGAPTLTDGAATSIASQPITTPESPTDVKSVLSTQAISETVAQLFKEEVEEGVTISPEVGLPATASPKAAEVSSLVRASVSSPALAKSAPTATNATAKEKGSKTKGKEKRKDKGCRNQ